MGMIKGFFGFQIFNSGIFGGWENLASIFLGGLIYVGIIWRIFRVTLEIFEAQKFCMGFFVG